MYKLRMLNALQNFMDSYRNEVSRMEYLRKLKLFLSLFYKIDSSEIGRIDQDVAIERLARLAGGLLGSKERELREER
jgi:hypothetical protein